MALLTDCKSGLMGSVCNNEKASLFISFAKCSRCGSIKNNSLVTWEQQERKENNGLVHLVDFNVIICLLFHET